MMNSRKNKLKLYEECIFFIGIHVYIFDKIGFDGGDVICFIVFSGSEGGFISLLRGEFLPPASSSST